MQEPATGKKSFGIAVIANDRFLDWLLPFLESYVATNASTPLYIIPYDDNVEQTRRAADIYGVHVVTPNSEELDSLARRLYPNFPAHRRRLRKFLSLALPLDEVLYLDIDIILYQDFGRFFGMLEPGKREFIVAVGTRDYVYNRKRKNFPFLNDVLLFNDGFFLTSKHILSLQHFYDVIDRDEAIFHAVRQRGMLFAQPLTNFVVHRLGTKLSLMPECFPDVSGETFYKAKGISFDAAGHPLDCDGKSIYFAHWAGAVGLPGKRRFYLGRRHFDPSWCDYARKAAARMQASIAR